jgi:hypothetical protein
MNHNDPYQEEEIAKGKVIICSELYKELLEKGLIEVKVVNGQEYVRLTAKGKEEIGVIP